jgi:uncharacterized protein
VLLSFRASNHKSIRDEQTLHMQPVYDKTRPALPVAAIFGANAAGKSNVLDAFTFMVDAVLNSVGDWRNGVPRSPFRLSPESSSTNSVFTVELLLDNIRWTYGFAVDSKSVREEWLYSYPQHRRRIIFERNRGIVTTGSASGLDRRIASSVAGLLPQTLLLSLAGEDRLLDGVRPVRRWFNKVDMLATVNSVVAEKSIIRRLENANDRSRLISLVVAADAGIVDVDVDYLLATPRLVYAERLGRYAMISRELAEAEESGRLTKHVDHLRHELDEITSELRDAASEQHLVFFHGPSRERFSFADESHGTRVWLGYLGPMLDALDSGGLLVVDEIDTSLHPHLTTQLIRLFHDSTINRNGAQLVFTTHDATLLGKYFGERILARDEVWFVEKNTEQETRLFSLAEFKAREDDNAERRYLTGSYGAIPQPSEHHFDDAVRGRLA